MKTTLRVLLCIVAAGAALLLIGARQSGSSSLAEEVQALRASVGDLQERMEKMEGLMSLTSARYREDAPARPKGTGSAPDRIMVCDTVNTIERSPEEFDVLQEYEDEADALERSLETAKSRRTSMAGSGGYRGGYRGGTKATGAGRQRRAHGVALAEYQRQLREKQGELKRLERELQEPRQIIVGSWDGVIVTLRTDRDLSRRLDKISPGDSLTWDGRRIHHDGSSQEWVITNVTKVDPADQPE